jgi:hypothetical protein
MDVSIEGLNPLKSFIADLENQLPYATAKALTATAKRVQSKVVSSTDKYIDRPTPFTKRGFKVISATKARLQSKVYILPIQEAYLRYQIVGGVRLPKGKAILIPVNVPLNKYGNMTRRKISTLLARPSVWSGVFDGVAGIWEEVRGSIVLRVAYEPKVFHRKKFPFWTVGTEEGTRVWKSEFDKALDEALATAK